jgi:23S rRNA pseudouridine2605 synthase
MSLAQDPNGDSVPAERLQKIIAAAGVASRRKAEELISAGRVLVNGQPVTELGSKADPEKDHIRVNGKLLKGAQRHVYLLLNKPVGFVTTVSDPEKRPTVMGLIRGVGSRVYPVGRLDYASEGLVLMTNDGTLAHKLMKAASHVPKTYVVKVSGKPSDQAIERLRGGLSIATDEGKRVRTSPAKIRIVKDAANPWYEVTLIEGRNRQIRRMFEEVGHHVEKIKRVKYGPLSLDVPPGKFRALTLKEVDRLRTAAGQNVGAKHEAAS